ncbi:DnaJ domain-containing protein [Janibacter terrae]|uniref:DnaJ domain-containing protein n=1 Tax=Janibacter terrae TaxID=103817 RepID=A0ABZ2F918_9MICO|nr:molecular chaperone DnaJ [Kytococcus sp.]
MASQDWLDRDFYDVLGVAKDADDSEIKKAYRKLAKQYHPDRNEGDDAAEQKFKDIGEAHAVLSDPEQRREYDAIRSMTGGGARFTAGGPGGGAGFEDIFSAFGGGGGGSRVRYSTGGGSPFAGGGAGEPDLEDILSMFGGGGRPGFGGQGAGFRAPRGPVKGQDLTARTELSFRDAVEGRTISLSVNGEKVNARIPAGVKDGQKIRLRGKGAHGDPGAERGDLILTVAVGKHAVYGRDGNNLTIDLPVTFAEAALGATVSVPTLDGTQVKVKIAPGTPSGRVLRLKGRGIATKTTTGDLLVKVQVVVPSELSDAEREAVEVLRDARTDDPRAALVADASA